MAMFGIHLTSMVLCIPIIKGYSLSHVTVIDKAKAGDYEKDINAFVKTTIENQTCGFVNTIIKEPRDPEPSAQIWNKKDSDCFTCGDKCYTVQDLMNYVGSDLECFRVRKMCQHIANTLNKEEQCDGGSYRCYEDDVHDSVGLPKWKPVCVCDRGYSGTNCIFGFVEKRKCTITVKDADERECDCLVNVNLQPWYRN